MPGTIPLRPIFRILPALTIPLAIALTQAPFPKPLAEAPHELSPTVLASTRSSSTAEPSSSSESDVVNSSSRPSTSILTRTATPASLLRPTHTRSHPKSLR